MLKRAGTAWANVKFSIKLAPAQYRSLDPQIDKEKQRRTDSNMAEINGTRSGESSTNLTEADGRQRAEEKPSV